MRRPAAVSPIALALGAMMLAPVAAAREEGPTEIEKCQMISKPGSYKLVNNLTFTGTTGTCLDITANFVTIDLAGFTITGLGFPGQTAITAGNDRTGITVRNGSISGFGVGVDLGGDGSIVEGLRVAGFGPSSLGIAATGIVKGNTVLGIAERISGGTGISATGIVTGNYVTGGGGLEGGGVGIEIGQGSTVIGNTALNIRGIGINVACPSNLTDNTVVNNRPNLVLNGEGCHDEDNLAP